MEVFLLQDILAKPLVSKQPKPFVQLTTLWGGGFQESSEVDARLEGGWSRDMVAFGCVSWVEAVEELPIERSWKISKMHKLSLRPFNTRALLLAFQAFGICSTYGSHTPQLSLHLLCKEGYSNDNEKFDKVEVPSPLPQGPKEVEAGSAAMDCSLPRHILLEAKVCEGTVLVYLCFFMSIECFLVPWYCLLIPRWPS